MKIESIDLFYFALPKVRDIADGSQDSFVVRVRSDTGLEGFGESDSSPLVAFACYCTPTSHSNIVPLQQILAGQTVDSPDDIRRIYDHARRRALDMAHLPHAYAAADIALWDLLGKHLDQPIYRLLGYDRQHAKRAYGSYLFGDTPDETRDRAAVAVRDGFTAVKFGWGPMGKVDEEFDIDLVRQARAGLGDDVALMVDAGTPWQYDDDTALQRARGFEPFGVTWLEEPLAPDAVAAYGRLSSASPIPVAAGEGCDTVRAAEDLLEHGGVHFLQIDSGRIGGITPTMHTVRLAAQHGATFVNHTFKSHILLAAMMHTFAGEQQASWLEYCGSGSPLIEAMVDTPIKVDSAGFVSLPEGPGLGIKVNLRRAGEFARHIDIRIDRKSIGTTADP